MRQQLESSLTLATANTYEVVLDCTPPVTTTYVSAQIMVRRLAVTAATFTAVIKYGGEVIDCACIGPINSANGSIATLVLSGAVTSDGVKSLTLEVAATNTGGNSIVLSQAPFNGADTNGYCTYLIAHE